MLRLSYWGTWSFMGLILLFIGASMMPSYRNLFLMNIFCFILLIVIMSLLQRVTISKKLIVLPFIGIYSYEIYLLHNKVLDPLGDAGYTNWYPIAFLMIVIPLSVLLNRLVKVILK